MERSRNELRRAACDDNIFSILLSMMMHLLVVPIDPRTAYLLQRAPGGKGCPHMTSCASGGAVGGFNPKTPKKKTLMQFYVRYFRQLERKTSTRYEGNNK